MTDNADHIDDSTPIVQPLNGEAIVEWVKNNEIKPFRYAPNNMGLWVLMLGGMITAGLAIVLYTQSKLTLPIHLAGFAVLIVATFWQWMIVIRWYGRLVGSYVLLSETEMLVGAGKSGWLLQRQRLTREHVFVDNMQRGRITMVLPLRIDGWAYDIHLVGPFMNMKELQPFVAEMISQLMADDEDRQLDNADEYDAVDELGDGEGSPRRAQGADQPAQQRAQRPKKSRSNKRSPNSGARS